jgi:hypothetical protein
MTQVLSTFKCFAILAWCEAYRLAQLKALIILTDARTRPYTLPVGVMALVRAD